MRSIMTAAMCALTLSMGLSASTAMACPNHKCPMEKSGKKCDHKNCKYCKKHQKEEGKSAGKAEEKPAGEVDTE